MENLDKLVNELRNLPNETQWLEFKHNNYEPTMIGQDISALANSAAMCEKSSAYMTRPTRLLVQITTYRLLKRVIRSWRIGCAPYSPATQILNFTRFL